MTYCCSVWGRCFHLSHERIELLSEKGRIFIIEDLKPIRQVINESDQRIFDEFVDIGTAHSLLIAPKRSYFGCNLRQKCPSVWKAKPPLNFHFFIPGSSKKHNLSINML